MIKRSVALRYSKALFDIDRSNGQLETRLKDFDSLLELMKNNPKLLKFIEAPQVTLQEKEKVLKTCLSDKLDVTFFHFLLYLIEKRRLNYLAQRRKAESEIRKILSKKN
jgi:F-type H+-transporting ATPase subunit delta